MDIKKILAFVVEALAIVFGVICIMDAQALSIVLPEDMGGCGTVSTVIAILIIVIAVIGLLMSIFDRGDEYRPARWAVLSITFMSMYAPVLLFSELFLVDSHFYDYVIPNTVFFEPTIGLCAIMLTLISSFTITKLVNWPADSPEAHSGMPKRARNMRGSCIPAIVGIGFAIVTAIVGFFRDKSNAYVVIQGILMIAAAIAAIAINIIIIKNYIPESPNNTNGGGGNNQYNNKNDQFDRYYNPDDVANNNR